MSFFIDIDKLFSLYAEKIVYICFMIGERVKELAAARGLLQKDLADKIGVSYIALKKWARAESVTVTTLEKIAGALEVEPFELLRPAGAPVLNPDGIGAAPVVVLSGVVRCPHCGRPLRVNLEPVDDPSAGAPEQ